MALKTDEMTSDERDIVQVAAKGILAKLRGETEETEPEVPAEVQKFLDENKYTIEAKKPSVMGAVDKADATPDPADSKLEGIGPQKKIAVDPGVIHDSTKREIKDFKISHAIGILAMGSSYPFLADCGLEIEVLRDQKATSRVNLTPTQKAVLEERKLALKDLNLGAEVAGGFWIPVEAHEEMIEKLRGQEIWMRMGVNYLPDSPKQQEWDKEGDDPNVYWPGDTPTDNISTSDMEYGQMTLTLHQMACLVKIRLNLIKHASRNVEARVRKQIIKSMAVEQTKVGLRGTGAKQPLGLFLLPSMVPYTTSSIGVPDFDNLLDAISAIRQRDGVVDVNQSAWVMSESMLSLFQKSKTGTAEYSYIMDLTNMPPDRILGLPVYTSSQIRTDLGVGSDETRMMLVGDKETISLADGGQTEITVLKELYARTFQIGVLASKEIDFGVFREQELQFLTGLTTP